MKLISYVAILSLSLLSLAACENAETLGDPNESAAPQDAGASLADSLCEGGVEDAELANTQEPSVTDPPSTAQPEERAIPKASLNLNLNLYQDNLTAWTKTRGSLDPEEEVVFYWHGHIFLDKDADPNGPAVSDFPGPIMRFEGFNIARFVPVADGIRMISREIAVYKNLQGEIIDCWYNGVLGTASPAAVPVVHVLNDPVNFTVSGGNPNVMGDKVVWTLEVMLAYPNPLSPATYPLFSAGNTYESSEMFNFYSTLEDINDPDQNSIPVTISWSRVGQLLPWMRAGKTQGKLIYHTYGEKVLDGFDGLPQHLKDYVMEHAPEYSHAPDYDTSPNTTSWRYFKKLIDSGEYDSSCQ
jgi:hypothetical protein